MTFYGSRLRAGAFTVRPGRLSSATAASACSHSGRRSVERLADSNSSLNRLFQNLLTPALHETELGGGQAHSLTNLIRGLILQIEPGQNLTGSRLQLIEAFLHQTSTLLNLIGCFGIGPGIGLGIDHQFERFFVALAALALEILVPRAAFRNDTE